MPVAVARPDTCRVDLGDELVRSGRTHAAPADEWRAPSAYEPAAELVGGIRRPIEHRRVRSTAS